MFPEFGAPRLRVLRLAGQFLEACLEIKRLGGRGLCSESRSSLTILVPLHNVSFCLSGRDGQRVKEVWETFEFRKPIRFGGLPNLRSA